MENLDKTVNKEVSDFIRLYKLLWRDKIFIISCTFIFALISVLFSLSLTNYYQSESIVTIEQNDSSFASQLGGLGAFSPLGLLGSQPDKSFEAIAMIKSRDFLKHLLSFEGVMTGIMAVKSYDLEKNIISYDDSLYDSENGLWREGQMPSYLEAHKEYTEIVSASINSSGFISVRVEHLSPVFAKKLLSLIIDETNKLAREKELKKTTAALSFLKQEIQSNSLSSINSSLSILIEVQYNKLVAARLNENYLLVPLENPFIPERRSKPNRVLICILGTILGGMLSVFWIIIWDSIKRENSS